jgi:hypothetical protein
MKKRNQRKTFWIEDDKHNLPPEIFYDLFDKKNYINNYTHFYKIDTDSLFMQQILLNYFDINNNKNFDKLDRLTLRILYGE